MYLDQTNRMQDVKLYSRNFNSCPSCKLIQSLLQYAIHNESKIQKNYLKNIAESAIAFRKKSVRKTAIIALLSHWQTLICSEVQVIFEFNNYFFIDKRVFYLNLFN